MGWVVGVWAGHRISAADRSLSGSVWSLGQRCQYCYVGYCACRVDVLYSPRRNTLYSYIEFVSIIVRFQRAVRPRVIQAGARQPLYADPSLSSSQDVKAKAVVCNGRIPVSCCLSYRFSTLKEAQAVRARLDCSTKTSSCRHHPSIHLRSLKSTASVIV